MRVTPPPWWNETVTWIFVIALLVLIGVGFLLATGQLGELPPAEQDLRPDTRDGEPAFDVVVRGYRMDEVDAQIAGLRARIDELEADGRTGGAPGRP